LKKVVEVLLDKELNEIDFKVLIAALSASKVDYKKMYEEIKQKDTD
jgi:hypothetical protein